MTQEELAEEFGVSRTLVARWERGWQVPPAWVAERLATRAQLSPLSATDLRTTLRGAGWSATELARALGLSVSTVSKWQTGRGVPGLHAAKVRRVLEQAEAGTLGEILEAVSAAPGLTREQLTRGRLGRSARVLRSLEELLRSGRLHERRAITVDAAGRRRALVGLFPGPGGASPPGLGTLVLERQAAGWSQGALARALGVSRAAVARWEDGRSPLAEPWQREIARILATPPRRPQFAAPKLSDAEMVRRCALALVRESPGLPFGRYAARMPGGVRRRWRVLRELVAGGELHTESRVLRDARGRRYAHEVLLPGPAPRARPMTGSELRELRRRRRFSRDELAAAVSISVETLGTWERGGGHIPAPWPEALRRALADRPRNPISLGAGDDEIERQALAAVAAEPGLTATAVTERMARGELRRRFAAIRRLVAAGRLEVRQGTSERGRRQAYLFPGAHPSARAAYIGASPP